jgi:hypothetical protein
MADIVIKGIHFNRETLRKSTKKKAMKGFAGVDREIVEQAWRDAQKK